MTSEPNPYQSPLTNPGSRRPVEPRPPHEVVKRIRGAWIAAAISASMTAVVLALAQGEPIFWIDVVFIILMGVGIYFRSRICAVIMFAYFAVSKLIMPPPNTFGWAMAALFLWLYFEGIRGTFGYHRWRRELEMESSATPFQSF